MWSVPIWFIILACLSVRCAWQHFKKQAPKVSGIFWRAHETKQEFWFHSCVGIMFSVVVAILLGLATAVWVGTVPMIAILGFVGYKVYKWLNAKLDQVIGSRD